MTRLMQAIRAFFSILFSGKLPEDIMLSLGLMKRAMTAPPASAKAAKPEAASPSPADGAVQLLAMLQKDSRFLDFLMEDLQSYSDEQVGASVRSVHAECRNVLNRVFQLTPVIDGVEQAETRLADFGLSYKDTAHVSIIGNIPADGKVESGILNHRGYKAEQVNLPPVKAGTRVIAPAEIEAR